MSTSTLDASEAGTRIPLCAIGASAGGVDAVRTLLRHLPDNLGVAYLVLELAPDAQHATADALTGCTTMPVRRVEDAPMLEADCIYVMPPDQEVVVTGDRVTARALPGARSHSAPIDMFFRSVARARGDGLGVVLGGAASDGAAGARALQQAGGVIFVQDPAEADSPAMAQDVIAAGVASFVAPLSQLALRIAEVARSKAAIGPLDEAGAADDLHRILGLLRTRTGHDFSSYKRATVLRRVLRRMQVRRVESLPAYAGLLHDTPEETQALFRDLLISVTQFFRDEAAFDTLARKAIAPMFDRAGEDGVRVWVAGCATGEEAYSVAILMLEEAERRNLTIPMQVFATDLDDGALRAARDGCYPRSIEAHVSQDRLRRFFRDEGTQYRVRRDLRQMVLFAAHSVLRDPPFLRLDLVSCRNLLIYLERGLQEQLLGLFHYALTEGGGLFLGSAENADFAGGLFEELDREGRLYRSLPKAGVRMPALPRGDATGPPRPAPVTPQTAMPAEPAARIHETALEHGAPPSVVVDETGQVLHLSARAGRYLLHSGGVFSARLADVVRPELRRDLILALERALGHDEPMLTPPVPVTFDGGARRIAMQVSAVPTGEQGGARALVLFLEAGAAPEAEEAAGAHPGAIPQDIDALRSDLKAAQTALAASRSEHGIAVEDLRAANEELHSIAEAYRATAEELEASREELQSMNEELQTVNAELKTKLEDISSAHNDLHNLTAASDVGTLFLDLNLRIRMFTPPMTDLFNITDRDVGRAITDFTSRLMYERIEADAQQVLHRHAPMEIEVDTSDGSRFIIKLGPYRTAEDGIDGVVLSFVDITAWRETEARLRNSELRYQMLFDSIDEGFAVIEVLFDGDTAVDMRHVEVNAAYERQTGLSDIVGRTAREAIPDLDPHWYDSYGRIARSGQPERFEAPAEALDRHFDVYVFPLTSMGPNHLGVLFRDISERKRAESQRDMLTREMSHRVKNTLAVVQALARQPAADDLTVKEYRTRFVGRIQAMARAHDHLLETHWQSADLSQLVEASLAAYGKIGDRKIKTGGDAVRLPPNKGLGLTMILHELATNASKYGALSVEDGELSVTWSRTHQNGADTVRVIWVERNGPEPGDSAQEGFGTKLIRQASAYELEGAAELSFDPEGLTAEIVFPAD